MLQSPVFPARSRAVHAVVLGAVLALVPPIARAIDVDAETEARLKKFLPNAYPKLAARAPVHIVSVGDSVTHGFSYDELRYSVLQAYPGVFASGLAKEFFYTGGVRDLDPEGDNPEKLEESLGPEITVQNFSRNGAEASFAFAPLTTDAFDQHPDIVMVMFGINDSHNNVPLGMFAETFVEIAKIIRARGADPIFVGPSPTLDADPRFHLGLSRPYTSVLRDVCERAGVFFADSEQLILSATHRSFAMDPATAFDTMVDQAKVAFDHGGGTEDFVHPAPEGHKLLGEAMAESLLRGLPASRYAASAKIRDDGQGGYVVDATVQNLGNMAIDAVLCPIGLEGVALPKAPDGKPTPDVAVALEAGASPTATIAYSPYPAFGHGREGDADAFAGIEEFVRTAFILVDEKEARIVDVNATIEPVAVVWGQGNALNLSDRFTVNAELANTSGAPLSGTYKAEWAGQVVEGKVEVAPGGRQPIELIFEFPSRGNLTVRDLVRLTVSTGGTDHRFQRELEASQNMGLGIDYPLFPIASYSLGATGDALLPSGEEPSMTLRAEADADALYLIFDIEGYSLVDSGDFPAANIDLFLDGRYYKNQGTIGYVHRIEIVAPADGSGSIKPLPLGALGNGYDRPIDVKNIPVKVSATGGGKHRIAVTIPRAYLYLHEWALGNGNSSVGLKTVVVLNDPADFAPDASPLLPRDKRVFARSWSAMGRNDARGLPQLELTTKPTGRWSVRVY